jgi:hypothetical protein
MSRIDQFEDMLETWVSNHAADMLGCEILKSTLPETNPEQTDDMALTIVSVTVPESEINRINDAMDADYNGFCALFIEAEEFHFMWEKSVLIDTESCTITFDVQYFI